MNDFPELEELIYKPERLPTTRLTKPLSTPQRQRQRGLFLKGPVPLDWLARASALPGKSLNVGLVLWFLKGLQGQDTVALSNKQLKEFGVSRYAKHRALDWLESAELITVHRKTGRSPLVTLREVRG